MTYSGVIFRKEEVTTNRDGLRISFDTMSTQELNTSVLVLVTLMLQLTKHLTLYTYQTSGTGMFRVLVLKDNSVVLWKWSRCFSGIFIKEDAYRTKQR